MNPQPQERLRELQLAFVGKLMAGLSHEFKNHLAIIKELSGLMDDLLLLEKQGQPINIDRFAKNISGINDRVSQAAEMSRFLSSFAHRMDQACSSFGVDNLLQEEIFLLRRFAWQKQVNMDTSFAADLPAIHNNPALLQFAIFCILWPILESLEKDGRIVITGTRRGSSAEITIAHEGAPRKPADITPWEEILPEALKLLGADLSRDTREDGSSAIVVTIPSIESPH